MSAPTKVAAHTPGPWRIYKRTRVHGGTNSSPAGIANCGPEHASADAETWAQCEANARLIAQAPALLAALETLTDQAEGLAGSAGDDRVESWKWFETIQPAIAAARAAIAAARGQS